MTALRDQQRLTRRQLIKAGGGFVVLVGGGLAASELLRPRERLLKSSMSPATTPVRSFRSRPDLKPPALAVRGANTSPGYVLVDPSWGTGSQAGPLIVDNAGEPVWFHPLPGDTLATTLRVQTYAGRPVLTWWEGREVQFYGQGEAVIADSSYRELARVRAAGGRQMDLHEFVLTPQGTALFTCFPQMVRTDLSSIGGARDATLIESIIQEVDIASGELLLEWRSLDHIVPSESYAPLYEPYDYLHINSISLTEDGNLLVSGRGTWSVYKLDRRSGAVIWRLGGKLSDFAMETGAQFVYQHHAVPVTADTISVFDNGSDGTHSPEEQSRAILINVDEKRRSARLGRSYTRHGHVLSGAMGSVQLLPYGRVLVGWGNDPYISEYTADGRLVTDARLMAAGAHSYRAFRSEWRAQPLDPPRIELTKDSRTGAKTLYTSWNGATEVSHWQVLAGIAPDALRTIGIARRYGFETAIPLGTAGGYVAAAALDRAGNRLGMSHAIKL
jgi:hypothetical protein